MSASVGPVSSGSSGTVGSVTGSGGAQYVDPSSTTTTTTTNNPSTLAVQSDSGVKGAASGTPPKPNVKGLMNMGKKI